MEWSVSFLMCKIFTLKEYMCMANTVLKLKISTLYKNVLKPEKNIKKIKKSFKTVNVSS